MESKHFGVTQIQLSSVLWEYVTEHCKENNRKRKKENAYRNNMKLTNLNRKEAKQKISRK